ncbi:helix-turn-helix domain-containing protein [Nibribacter koreensis]|uniref:Helix-turn-helix domain-containing protein n=1 Tax=Nibribacter koreensis TaxID=1084519 RepID=A0ABP8F5Y1_9BACT
MMNKIVNYLAQIEALLKVQSASSKKVLTVDEASKYLGLSDSMLYSLTSQRLIPHSKPSGKKVFFDREDLERWALSNRVRTIEEIQHQSNGRKPKSN